MMHVLCKFGDSSSHIKSVMSYCADKVKFTDRWTDKRSNDNYLRPERLRVKMILHKIATETIYIRDTNAKAKPTENRFVGDSTD